MARPTANPATPPSGRAARALRSVDRSPTSADASPAAGRTRSRRDWAVDVTCLLIAIGFGLLGYSHIVDQGTGTALRIVDVVSGVAMCGALFLRRRWPVQLVLLTAVTGAYSQTASGASLILLFSVAVHREARVVAPLLALQIPGILIYAAVWPDDTLSYWPLVLFVVTILGFVTAWGAAIRSRRQLLTSLQERAERAEREQQLLVGQARDQERARIAREMHDVLAHRISLVSLHAGALEFRPDAPSEEIARAAGVIRASAHEALEDLREVIGVLRDGSSLEADDDVAVSEVRPQPALTDLPALLQESREAGVRIEQRLDAAEAGVSGAVGRTAYRVVQEGLTNARKHAWGTVVHVSSSGSPGAAGLTVAVRTPAPVGGATADPGIPGAGTGLIGLQERVALAGGHLESGPTPDGGFLLRAWLPWSDGGAGAVGADTASTGDRTTAGAGRTADAADPTGVRP